MSPKTIILASNLTSYKRSLLTLGGVNRLFGDKLMKYNTIRKNYVGGFSTKGAKDLLHLYDTVSNLSDDKRNFVQKREAIQYYLPFMSQKDVRLLLRSKCCTCYSKTRNRHTERRTTYIIQPKVAAILNGSRIASMFTANTKRYFGLCSASEFRSTSN